jgi:hypothetical protein
LYARLMKNPSSRTSCEGNRLSNGQGGGVEAEKSGMYTGAPGSLD